MPRQRMVCKPEEESIYISGGRKLRWNDAVCRDLKRDIIDLEAACSGPQ